MSPKSNSLTRPVEDVSTSSAFTSKSSEETNEIKRDPIFLRIEKPFFVDQHVYHIVWLGGAHLFAAYYMYLDITKQVPRSVAIFEGLYGYLGGLGITVGCHRYWTHKTFKATLPLQILLMILQTIANQLPIHKWCLDHRIHHKYTDTDADPHNATRGFWFSHLGWLILPKHKEHLKKLKTFDVSDLERDPVVRFQSQWYWTLTAIFHLIIPISIIYYVWDMPLLYCAAANFRRFVVSLHFTWCVNSVAHIHGTKPYDKNITAVDNAIVAFVAVGEGFHNYHHTFPWDYKASEIGWKINISTMFIDFFAWLGWAYDLKTVSQKMLKERSQRTGDGSLVRVIETTEEDYDQNMEEDFEYKLPAEFTELVETLDEGFWGWDDENVPEDFRKVTKILRPERTN